MWFEWFPSHWFYLERPDLPKHRWELSEVKKTFWFRFRSTWSVLWWKFHPVNHVLQKQWICSNLNKVLLECFTSRINFRDSNSASRRSSRDNQRLKHFVNRILNDLSVERKQIARHKWQSISFGASDKQTTWKVFVSLLEINFTSDVFPCLFSLSRSKPLAGWLWTWFKVVTTWQSAVY